MAPERLVSLLSAAFGVLALLLTSVGFYGILAYTVSRRTNEFGIRMAFGAGRPAILRMVLKEGLAMVATGLAAGLAAAVSLSHRLAKLAAAVILTAVAAASYGPARHATAVEPVTALRYE